MKYVILYSVTTLICILVGWLIAGAIAKKKGLRTWKKRVLTVLMSFLLITAYNISYLQVYYHADERAKACLAGNEAVQVSHIGRDYFFDGPGERDAMVFFPGARVEETAYAPLMCAIAERGIDCFLMKMPSRMAVFGMNAPERVIGAYDYEKWYVCGHSLGGVVAAKYAADHAELVDGVVILAAHPDESLPETLPLLSIYGSKDGCLSRELYEKKKKNWPADSEEVILEGGNHAGFGNYGKQRGDQEADLSPDEQQRRTAEEVVRFSERMK